MKAWGLFLFLVLAAAGCTTQPRSDATPDVFEAAPLPDFENFDRAGAGAVSAA